MTDLPKIIIESGFDFSWDEKSVWELDYPSTDMDINELAWHFDIPFWNFGGERYNLSPNDVINSPQKYKAEYDRIMAADESYPIDVMENKGRLTILDGLHRLVKQKIQGKDVVKVRIIPRSEIKNIAK